MSEPTKHNHFTRDIKSPGKCPACDEHHLLNKRSKMLAKIAASPTPDDLLALQMGVMSERQRIVDIIEEKISEANHRSDETYLGSSEYFENHMAASVLKHVLIEIMKS